MLCQLFIISSFLCSFPQIRPSEIRLVEAEQEGSLVTLRVSLQLEMENMNRPTDK